MNLHKKLFFLTPNKIFHLLNPLGNKYHVEKYCIKAVYGNFSVAYSSFLKRENSVKCYNCQSDMKLDAVYFFCKNCKALADIEVFKHFNIFELFNLDVDYDLDKALLKQKFNDIQKLYHPDKNSQSASLDKINDASGYINDAYRLLCNDIDRATYLLKFLFNYKMSDSESIEDETFLQEIVKVNEQIDSSEDITSLMKQYEKKYENHINELKLHFREKNCDNIIKTLKKIKFVDKILERIKNM